MSRTKKNPFTSKPIYAIVVDGDCESWYMSMIKRNESSIKVDIKPEIPENAEKLQAFDINNPDKSMTQMPILFELLGLKKVTKKIQ